MATNKQKAAEKKARMAADEEPQSKSVNTDALVEKAIANMKKEHGNTFSKPKNKSSELRPVIPSGIFALDHVVIGSGGFPRGRIVEIFGPPSGGKGTLSAQLFANAQRIYRPDQSAYNDAECALDMTYSARLGMDTDNMLHAEPSYGEQALQMTEELISTGGMKLVIVDSVAALVPKAELDGEMSDAHVGLQARLMGQALRKLGAIVSKTNTCLVFINQTRDKVGVSFGSKTDTPGGKALKFWSSVRLSIDRLSQYKEKDEVVGSITKIKTAKNKTFRPFVEHDFNLMFDMPGQQPGFDGIMSLVDVAIANNVWKRDGANYMLASTGEIVKGKVNLRDALRDDAAVRKITEEATLLALGKTPDYIKRALRG